MRKGLLIALAAACAWVAWKQLPRMFARPPAHEVVIQNRSGGWLKRVRLRLGGRTFAAESLAAGRQVAFPFRLDHDASFALSWDQDSTRRNWSGGRAFAGPLLQRHVIRVEKGGRLDYFARPE
ncbi:MAG: hypothetical protein E6K78_11755 [Candidatus Eisenbacteria bacterium]|uniref:Uncharacterized protein n=1 Tax=Eiseniibacteriota bacterium TaxID=2212470 RepID=A0A538TFP3_UNCEI|nr:MAG: hypothetical protein E6K78_11755 [Candidatus Eisenbacteria bacterium]